MRRREGKRRRAHAVCAHERAGACGKTHRRERCIMYLSLYLLSWELLCHRNDFQVPRYLSGMPHILMIYLSFSVSPIFLGSFCRRFLLYHPVFYPAIPATPAHRQPPQRDSTTRAASVDLLSGAARTKSGCWITKESGGGEFLSIPPMTRHRHRNRGI